MLIESGADVNTNKGWSALMSAAINGRERCIKLLTEAGVDVNEISCWGHAVVTEAILRNSPESVKALAEAGADLNAAETKYGFTALVISAGNFKESCVEALVEAGAQNFMNQSMAVNDRTCLFNNKKYFFYFSDLCTCLTFQST